MDIFYAIYAIWMTLDFSSSGLVSVSYLYDIKYCNAYTYPISDG